MKLVLQIALGVFLGTTAAQLSIDAWRGHSERVVHEAEYQRRAEQEKVRQQRGERIRALILQSRQNDAAKSQHPPTGFVPEDVQEEEFEKR